MSPNAVTEIAQAALPHSSVLVTGSEGFLGRQLVAELEKMGIRVRGYDLPRGEDILNPEQFEGALVSSGATAVIHLAAVADLNIVAKDISLGWKINVEGTRVVLEACQKHGARLLFASTCCAYGNNHCHPSSEKSPVCPAEEYAQQKVEGEKLITAVGGNHTCMRLATFYGPGMRPALATAIFLEKTHKNEPITVHGDGKQTRTYTYVGDIVSGIIAILNAKVTYPIVNISTEESRSVNELIQYSFDAVGRQVPIINGTDRKGQVFQEEIDNSLLRSLGWVPKMTLKEGMKVSYEAYAKAQGRQHA